MPKRRADSPSSRQNQTSKEASHTDERVASTSTTEQLEQHTSKRRRLDTANPSKTTSSLKNQSSRRSLKAKLAAERMNTQVLNKSKSEPEPSSGPPTPDSLPREIESTRDTVEEELAQLRKQLEDKDQVSTCP